MILSLSPDHDDRAELRPFEYDGLSKRRVRRRFRFDILIARQGSDQHKKYLDLFQRVKGVSDLRKGVVEVRL